MLSLRWARGVPSTAVASAVALLSPSLPSTPAGPGQEDEHAAGPDDRGALPAEQPRLPALPAAPEADAALRLRASQRLQGGGSAARPPAPSGTALPRLLQPLQGSDSWRDWGDRRAAALSCPLRRDEGRGERWLGGLGLEMGKHQVQPPPKNKGAGPTNLSPHLPQLPGPGGSHRTEKGVLEGTANEWTVSRWRKLQGAFNGLPSPDQGRGSSPRPLTVPSAGRGGCWRPAELSLRAPRGSIAPGRPP